MSLLNPARLLIYVLRALCMLISLPAHEAAHALSALVLGDDTARNEGRLTLNPFAHFNLLGTLSFILLGIGWADPVPVDPRRFRSVSPRVGMALTAAAGPLTNLLLAFVSVVAYKFVYYLAPDTVLMAFVLYFFNNLAVMNLALAAFNLLPLPPFDGSRLFSLLLPAGLYRKSIQYERYIFFVIFALLMLGVMDAPLAMMQNALWDFLNWSTRFVEVVLGLAGPVGTAV